MVQAILWDYVPEIIQSQVVDHLPNAIPSVQSEGVLRSVLVGSPVAHRQKRAATATVSYGEDADIEFDLPEPGFDADSHSSVTSGVAIGEEQTVESITNLVSVPFNCSEYKFPMR